MALSVNFDYQYDGDLYTDILHKPSVGTPPLNRLFRVWPGINFKAQIPQILPLSKITKKASVNCERNASQGNAIENVELEVMPMEISLEWCKDQFEANLTGVGNILAEELKKGYDVYNPEGTIVQQTVNKLITDAARRDALRVLIFGDTSSNSDDYDQMDGVLTRLLEDAGEGASYSTRTVDISGVDVSTILASMRSIYNAASNELFQLDASSKYFLVTRKIWELILAAYESNVNATEAQFMLLKHGPNGTELSYRGIEVIVSAELDTHLQDEDNPHAETMDDMILYTTKENHALGMQKPSDMNNIRGKYHDYQKVYTFDGLYKMGYQKHFADFQVLGYDY